ncbi:hypothetical protein WOC76_20195 [Methylocystis sp. IM3]|uniref:hypothetical protein n=1 Tax=Methylocystis sp. IM3 TaxID=3136722 RepID=UPI0031197F6F
MTGRFLEGADRSQLTLLAERLDDRVGGPVAKVVEIWLAWSPGYLTQTIPLVERRRGGHAMKKNTMKTAAVAGQTVRLAGLHLQEGRMHFFAGLFHRDRLFPREEFQVNEPTFTLGKQHRNETIHLPPQRCAVSSCP